MFATTTGVIHIRLIYMTSQVLNLFSLIHTLTSGGGQSEIRLSLIYESTVSTVDILKQKSTLNSVAWHRGANYTELVGRRMSREVKIMTFSVHQRQQT